MTIPIVAIQSAPARDSKAAKVSNSESIDAEMPNLFGLKILAIDDEADTRDMIIGVLEQLGARVMTAGSAREALEALPGWKPDVLVCDIGMPGEDGYALIRKVRELETEQERNTPAIALTGYVRVEDRLRALFSLLGSRRTALKTLCTTPGIEGDIFLGFSSGNGQGGDTISPHVLSLIADTGLSLSLDLYPPSVDEDENDTSPRWA